MRLGKVLLGFATALCGLSFVASVQAAPTLTMGILLQDTSNNTISPISGSSYQITQGTTFRVLITATLGGTLNLTDNSHDAGGGPGSAPQVQLGIQTLSFNLISNGTNNVINPANNGAGKWALTGATLATRLFQPISFGQSAGYNLLDQPTGTGGDGGDLDPSGVGFSNTSPEWGDSGASVAEQQAIQNGVGTQNQMIRGGYLATTLGTNTLVTAVTTANSLIDAAAADNSLTSEAISLITNGNITITVVAAPEPASMGLLGLGSMALLAMRRRRVA